MSERGLSWVREFTRGPHWSIGKKRLENGHQKKWFSAFRQRTDGVFYRNGAGRPADKYARSRTRFRRQRHLRTRRPDRVAYTPARSDLDRDGRLWPGTALGRAGRGNPSGGRGLGSPRREAFSVPGAHA